MWAATVAAAGLALAAPSGPAEIAYMHDAAIWTARADGSAAHVLVAPPPPARCTCGPSSCATGLRLRAALGRYRVASCGA